MQTFDIDVELLEFKLREKNWTWRNPGRSVYFPWA